MSAAPVQTADVSFSYRNRPVLQDCCLTLEKGITALVGRNGAGKTTLMRLLATVMRPHSGVIRVNGCDVWASSDVLYAYRASMGWAPQKVRVTRWLQVCDYLRHLGWQSGMTASQAVSETERIIELLSLQTEARRSMHRLSGGTFQRVILAGALMGQPDFLLLDEPTVGLDPLQRAAYVKILKEVASETTVLISTHLLEDVAGCAQRVVLLESGRVTLDRELENLRGVDGRVHTEDLATLLFT